MIYPIVAYGDPVLRKKCKPLASDYPDLKEIISDMFETMYGAQGIGLAAPQIGIPIRIFIVDASPFAEDDVFSDEEREYFQDFKKVFINAKMIDENGDDWAFNEGCLSIPFIREDVFRQSRIKIEYQDEDFKTHVEEFDGLVARIIQHEYDHIEGVLFTDKISSLKKRLIKSKLSNISKGNIEIDYKMRYPNLNKRRK
ncbi:MAG: peptide deformylase [Bacteroidia bacterium]|nr:peptide deformylase [Bacteroidia bacterium]NNK69060.1 peptide deformylase [Flavobacteriaceae bacterium]NNL79166.1 peptide deformylase [Flavobacteriaceae bacterium]